MTDTPFKTTDRDGAQVDLPTARLVADAVVTLQAALVPLLDSVEALLAATPLPTGAATEAKLEAVRALLAGTLAISATALPLPVGAATAAGVTAVVTAVQALAPLLDGLEAQLAGQLTIGLPAGAATQATLAATAPADDAIAIVPSDGADLATVPKALMVTVAGTLSIRGAGGTTVSLGQVVAGQIIPIRARRVMATGTSATVVGLV